MVYVGIGFILLLIIVPVLAILPSAKQKEQMAKRQRAMAQGIGVDLTRTEDPDPDPEKYLSNTGKPLERKISVAAYRIQRQQPDNWRRSVFPEWEIERVASQQSDDPGFGWRWVKEPQETTPNELTEFIRSNIPGFANDVVRIEEKKSIISIYWNEVGEEQEAIDFLKSCAAIDVTPLDSDEGSGNDI